MAQITLRDYLQQTEDAISSSRVDDALTRCQFMLSHFPEALEIQRLLGEVYLAQERMEDAQQIFDWVLTNDPENVLAYCNRAHLSERTAEFDAALDCYQQAYELSRGNGQIREEFNQLSGKIGQKGFMFSRAGLARLYMRGGLLSEAIQEWEAALAVSPDRLDARVGLLETYWRAGDMENVEQLAAQILHDVPGCLKALLLQASVVSTKDIRHAQELLRRAEALDPDHTTAQMLFADALASQPDDAFLQLLKKAPTLLPDQKPVGQAQGQRQTASAPVSDPINALGNGNNMDALAQWSQDAYGSNDTTLIKPRSDKMPAPVEMGVTPLWGQERDQNHDSLPNMPLPPANGTAPQASWNAPTQEMNKSQSSQQTHTESQAHSPEPWELLQDALNQFDTIGVEPHTATGSQTNLYREDVPSWENIPGSGELSQPPALDISASASSPLLKPQESINSPGVKLDPWGVPMEEKPLSPATDNLTPPPNWLSTLAQTDRPAKSGDSAAFTLESLSESKSPLVGASPEPSELQAFLSQQLSPNSGATASPAVPEQVESLPSWTQPANEEKLEEDEESFFGPSWLKSLGATTMDEEALASTAAASEIQAPQPQYVDLQHEEHAHTPFAQYSEAPMQVPPAQYQSVPSYNEVPEPNPYELWQQAGVNNTPQTYEQPSWTSSEVVQQPEQINYEAQSPYEDAYAASNYLPQSSVDLPVEQPAQQEAVPGKAEHNLMTTLEELEKSLWSKGFIPLEPNSLATIATQTQESAISPHDLDALKASAEAHDLQDYRPSPPEQEQQEPQETPEVPSLSSALAQLGSFVKESPSPITPSLASSRETVEQDEQPSWLQALKNSSSSPTVPATPIWPDTSFEPSAPAAFAGNLSQPSTVEVQPMAAPSYDLPQPAVRDLQQTVKAPAMLGNPLLDVEDELEATMRRPAVRLQPLQHHSAPSQRVEEIPSIIPRSSSRERIERPGKMTKPAGENLSYRERLVKGYQHQLVGDYDEAMQEYRLIIRSGTDLLNEVVGNVRALLKLAPNYSVGYRVLGDAYMRQGEYLQAMEAYNKALTMTKKVKSRA